MRILLSNDDGIFSEGIGALARVLSKKHEVIVAAPASEQSGMSHALTVRKRLLVSVYEELVQAGAAKVLRIGGTPTDCVKLYLDALAGSQMPELVISGINHGSNLGSDVLYSGTVGAAIEGYFHGISSIAISLDYESDVSYTAVAEFLSGQLDGFFQRQTQPYFYNINFPRKLRGIAEQNIAFTKLGHRDYANAFRREEAEDGQLAYIMAGEIIDAGNDNQTDIFAVEHGYVSFTPLQLDLTDYSRLHIRD